MTHFILESFLQEGSEKNTHSLVSGAVGGFFYNGPSLRVKVISVIIFRLHFTSSFLKDEKKLIQSDVKHTKSFVKKKQ